MVTDTRQITSLGSTDGWFTSRPWQWAVTLLGPGSGTATGSGGLSVRCPGWGAIGVRGVGGSRLPRQRGGAGQLRQASAVVPREWMSRRGAWPDPCQGAKTG